MPTNTHCPSCGARVTSGELCTPCLLALGLGLAREPEGGAEPGMLSSADAAGRSPNESRICRFGDYELLTELARGGMGVVYKARQVGLGRIVAVKRILAGRLADKELVQRFRTEASAAASLQHPNIVAIHEVGVHQGEHYLAMELVEGPDLVKVVGHEPLEARRAARYAKAIALAIHHAHEHNILHRDLKPSNVLIDAHDQPRITDFGLAKRLEKESELTLTGQVLGSPGYMPPEQACATRGRMSRRSDVYSLGAVLYHLLTSRPPFRASTPAQTIQRVLNDEPVPPRLLNDDVPRDLETICLKCLEKDPGSRYGTALELAEELERFLEDRPILARPVSPLGKAWRWCRRKPVVAGLAAASSVLLVTLAVGASMAAMWLNDANRTATRRLFDSLVDKAESRRSSGRAGQRLEGLSALGEAAQISRELKLGQEQNLKLRNSAIACLAVADLRDDGAWPIGAAGGEVAFDHSLTRFALFKDSLFVSVCRLADRVEVARILLDHFAEGRELQFAQNGQLLGIRYRDQNGQEWIELWRLDANTSLLRLAVSPAAQSIALSADGRWMACSDEDDSLALYAVPTGQNSVPRPLARLFPGETVRRVRCSPDGRHLAVVLVSDPNIVRVVTRDGAPVCELAHANAVGDLDWHRSGPYLATACRNWNAYVWDVSAGEPLAVLKGHGAQVSQIAFAEELDLVATGAFDGTTRLWNPWTGRERVREERRWGARGTLQFSPDGRWLAFATGESFGRIEVKPTPEIRTTAIHDQNIAVYGVDYSADGRLLVTAGYSHDGKGDPLSVRLWDAQSGRQLAALPVAEVYSALFEPDGNHLVTSGQSGLMRWPLQRGGSSERTDVSVGQPAVLAKVANRIGGWAALSRDGRRAAVSVDPDHFVLLDPVQPSNRITFGPTDPNLWTLAITPDARWLATGTWTGNRTMIWEAGTGKVANELPGGGRHVTFSGDGRWLLVNNGGVGGPSSLWSVGDWKLRQRWSGGVTRTGAAFSPDGRLLALATVSSVRLVDPESGKEIATLSDRDPVHPNAFCFSPDGRQLAVGTASGSIQRWDLHGIRAHLTKLGLDWEQP
jgi:serine/threonine protein kinase/WD40 repeat protein